MMRWSTPSIRQIVLEGFASCSTCLMAFLFEQEQLFKQHKDVTICNQIIYCCLWSSAISLSACARCGPHPLQPKPSQGDL